MPVRVVNPETLTKPVGYAHAAVGTGKAIALAGKMGCGLDGKVEKPGDLVAQFAKALDNLMEALRAAGGAPQDVASLRIYVTDVKDYRRHLRALGDEYRTRFGRHFPAMALLGVRELFEPGAVVEIEGLAYV